MSLPKSRLFLPALVLLLAVFLSGCGSSSKNTGNLPYLGEENKDDPSVVINGQPDQTAPLSTEKVEIVLYFGDNNGYLAAEKRSIPKTPAIARATLQELIKGPSQGSSLLPTLPPGTSLLDIKIKDGVATADFSSQLKSGHKGGSAGERVTVYSIVNTLTQFPSVQRVQILVEGQPVETLAGHMDLLRPLERSGDIIRQNSGNNL